jgi:hypothetical protein
LFCHFHSYLSLPLDLGFHTFNSSLSVEKLQFLQPSSTQLSVCPANAIHSSLIIPPS